MPEHDREPADGGRRIGRIRRFWALLQGKIFTRSVILLQKTEGKGLKKRCNLGTIEAGKTNINHGQMDLGGDFQW